MYVICVGTTLVWMHVNVPLQMQGGGGEEQSRPPSAFETARQFLRRRISSAVFSGWQSADLNRRIHTSHGERRNAKDPHCTHRHSMYIRVPRPRTQHSRGPIAVCLQL